MIDVSIETGGGACLFIRDSSRDSPEFSTHACRKSGATVGEKCRRQHEPQPSDRALGSRRRPGLGGQQPRRRSPQPAVDHRMRPRRLWGLDALAGVGAVHALRRLRLLRCGQIPARRHSHLCCACLRIPYSLGIATFGGRNWTVFPIAVLAIPTISTIGLLSHPGLPLWPYLACAALTGCGRANYAASMTNTHAFYPHRRKGFALGFNAGAGNLGVPMIQLVGLLVIAIAGYHQPYWVCGLPVAVDGRRRRSGPPDG